MPHHGSPHPPARKAVVVSDHAPADLVKQLSSSGLEVRPNGDPSAADVLLVDIQCLGVAEGAIESIVASRVCALLARCGDDVPGLHEAIMSQTERGLFKAVLEHTKNHLGRGSKILGLDRNTCARKARAFGLVDEPSRGRKPAKAKATPPRAGRGRKVARAT